MKTFTVLVRKTHPTKANRLFGFGINLSYAVPDEILFVSLTGNGEIVKDEAKKKELWYEDLARWFPKGPEDKKLVLIKVDAKLTQYWGKEGDAELAL